MMKFANTISWVAAIGVLASLAIVMPVFAQTSATEQSSGGAWVGRGGVRTGMMAGVFGTVTAVDVNGNANMLTVTSAARSNPRPMPEMASTTPVTTTAPIVYTVDATNAKIYKGSATTTVSVASIAQGDTVIVQGTTSGTNITATVIRDGAGKMMGGRPGMPGTGFGRGASSTASTTPIIQGNGEPVIGGNITAISGTTLTVTNASNVTYTINAASSTVVVKGASSTLSDVAVGDSVIVQGAVNGNSVTASSIIDQGVKSANASSTSQSGGGGFGGGLGGFFGSIGGFFKHLFGF
jgi:hypothetical protein